MVLGDLILFVFQTGGHQLVDFACGQTDIGIRRAIVNSYGTVFLRQGVAGEYYVHHTSLHLIVMFGPEDKVFRIARNGSKQSAIRRR